MAHSLSAKKRVRQNLKDRALNRWRKGRIRTATKQFNELILRGSVDDASQQLDRLYKILDQVSAKGTIHKNTARRTKSRLAARLVAKKTVAV